MTTRTGTPPSAAVSPTARPGTVLAGVLRTNRRSMVLWAIAVSAVAVMYTSFWPSMGGDAIVALVEQMPAGMVEVMGLDAMTSAAGYVGATVFSLLGAILTLVCGIGAGARLLAGTEEDGVLELEIAAPASRGAVFGERLVALWLTVLAVAVGVTIALLAMIALLDLDIEVPKLLAQSLSLWVFAGSMGTLAYGVGAATGRRGVALGVASAVAAVGYVLSYLSPLVDGADWMGAVSPYEWYIGDRPLQNGLDAGGLTLLLALAALAVLAGWTRFRRRDLLV